MKTYRVQVYKNGELRAEVVGDWLKEGDLEKLVQWVLEEIRKLDGTIFGAEIVVKPETP